MHVHVCTCVPMRVQCMYMHVPACICMHACVCNCMNVFASMLMYVHGVHACLIMRVWTYICTNICMSSCMRTIHTREKINIVLSYMIKLRKKQLTKNMDASGISHQ